MSFILTGYNGFTTPAGYIGHRYRVDHDLSLLIPELWARLQPFEKDPAKMISEGELEKLEDFEYEGKKIPASILGYRITDKFVIGYFGRVFENPNVIFPEDMLKPELQSMEQFADGVLNIVESQQRVAESYFRDGSIESACPPLKALLHIMAYGEFEGKGLDSPEIRKMFTYDYLVESDWYKSRIMLKQQTDIAQMAERIRYIEKILREDKNLTPDMVEDLSQRLEGAKSVHDYLCSYDYAKFLYGTIGRDNIRRH